MEGKPVDRLQKLLSSAGVCSRRQAEVFLREGRVSVNGTPAHLGDSADPARDEIKLDGRPVAFPAEKQYIMLHKPRGVVTTLSDERGRPTVAALTADCPGRVYPVGRLDMDSEGLLLLTNDGELARRLAHPSGEAEKTYHVWVRGPAAGAAERLSRMTELEGEPILPARAEPLRQGREEAALAVTIRQGKNRQIRRMCAACGLEVTRLRRVREHTLSLGSLPPGKWRYLTAAEVRALKGR